MKKTLKVFAIVACALGMLLTSCSQPQTPSNIEVVTVDATEITVKALPGYNKVTWTPVSNANYVLYINGEKQREYASNDYLMYLDGTIVDGKEYTYTVYTIPAGLKVVSEFNEEEIATIGGNKVAYYTKGNKSSATVKAIVPPFVKDGKLVTALDVIDYDPEAKAEDKVTAENINFFYDEDENSVKFSYPVKDYLNYTYKLYRGNELEVFGKNATAETINGSTTSSKNFGTTATVAAAGEYTLVVEVTCDNYKTSKITASKKVTVDALIDAEVPTSAPKAYYIDEGTKARIIWTPAKKADKSYWDPKNYTVYVKDNKNVYTPINLVKSTTVGEDGAEITKEEIKTLEGTQKGDKVYYVEYDVTNNKVAYTFYVVLNDNGKLETAKKEATLNVYDEIKKVVFDGTANAKTSWTATDKTAKTDDAVLTITGLSDDQEIEFVKYKVLSKKANGTYTVEQALLDSEFVDAKVPEKYTKNDIIVKDIPEDSKVVFLYAIKENGKKSHYGMSVLQWNDLSDSTEATISCKEDRTDYTKDPTYLVKFSSDNYDDANNWTYKVYYAKLDSNNATLDGVSKWTSIGDITPTLNEGKTAWEAEVKGITLAATTEIKDPLTNKTTLYKDTYAFKIVKASKVIDYTITEYSTRNVTKTVAE